jgi:phosphohistidine phosphatase
VALRLLLLRHAKSSRDDPSLDDVERPLNARGRRDAPAMAAFMAAEGYVPDVVLCSSAVRTRETLELLAQTLELPTVRYDRRLYLAEPETILARIARSGGAARQLMVVGHNPGLHALALDLVGKGPRKDLERLATKFPTCALAVIDLPAADWRTLSPRSGRLVHFAVPRDLAGSDD